MTSTQSKACCNTPAIVSKGYEAKGSYTTLNGLKTYVTGPSSATSAILYVFDIFGFFPQSLQGADILASTGGYKVFMPDFFEGSPADISWYPPKDKETEQKLGEFFSTKAAPPKTLEKIPGVISEAGKFEKWGAVGFCWGGKVVGLACGKDTLFSAAAEAHPAMVDPSDAEKITIPICMLASGDEDVEAVKAFESKLTVPHFVDTYPDQIHGWMAARSDLENPTVKKEYERGYQALLKFFGEHL